MKRTGIFIVVLIVIFLFAWARTNYLQNAFLVADGFTQGTTYHIVVKQKPVRFFLHGERPDSLNVGIDSVLHHFDLSLSTYNPESIISRINRNDTGVKTDSLFRRVFRVSKEIYEQSDGAFDITVGPLVNAWGFGPDAPDEKNIPNVDSLLPLVGMNKIHLDGNIVVKSIPAIYLDVNAIAQGYSVDVVAGYLRNQGYRHFLIEIGGEIRAVGSKGLNEPWKVGIDKPFDNNTVPGETLQAILKLEDQSLATSGNYRKFYIKDGVKYAHTIDPRTGMPARNRLLSVTLITRQCIYADGYATACMVMGLEKARHFVNKLPGVEAFMVYSGNDGSFLTWESPGFQRYVVKEE